MTIGVSGTGKKANDVSEPDVPGNSAGDPFGVVSSRDPLNGYISDLQ